MAVNKEIWVPAIVEPFYSEASFLQKVVNHDEFVNERTVHVPNAGSASKISKNAKKFPIDVEAREDVDLTYSMNVFRFAPTVIQNAEAVELSYNKRESVINVNRAALYDEVAEDIVQSWVSGVETPINGSTGTIKEHITTIATQFATAKVPFTERYIMFSADDYYKFLAELTAAEQFAFSASADAAKGVLGMWMGFQVLQEFYVPKKVKLLAWYKGALSKAISELQILSNDQDATYFGDVVSGELRAGGSIIRKDIKGVAVVDDDGVQDAAPKLEDENLSDEE